MAQLMCFDAMEDLNYWQVKMSGGKKSSLLWMKFNGVTKAKKKKSLKKANFKNLK